MLCPWAFETAQEPHNVAEAWAGSHSSALRRGKGSIQIRALPLSQWARRRPFHSPAGEIRLSGLVGVCYELTTADCWCEGDIPTVKCGRELNSLVLSSLALLAVEELLVPGLGDWDDRLGLVVRFGGQLHGCVHQGRHRSSINLQKRPRPSPAKHCHGGILAERR